MKTNIEIPKERVSGEWVYIEEERDEIFIEDCNNKMQDFCEEIEEAIG